MVTRRSALARRRRRAPRAVLGQLRAHAPGRGVGGVLLGCRHRARKPHDVLPHGAILFASLGFSTVDALVSVTSLAADACGLGHRKGRLATGYDADLLAVGGDLAADMTSLLDPRAVFRAGRPVALRLP